MSENITYRHLKDDENIPYATLALIYSKDKQTAYFAGSLCSEEDNFSYKRGREIANYRMAALVDHEAKNPKQLVHVVENVTFEEAKEILHNLYIYGTKPEEIGSTAPLIYKFDIRSQSI